MSSKSGSQKTTLPSAMEEGLKLKMPVSLLGQATRSQNALDDLRKAGSVEGVVQAALRKFEDDVGRLRDACDLVKPVNDAQRAAKEDWMERNLGAKDKYLAAIKSVFESEAPRLQINDVDVEKASDMDGEKLDDLVSVRSQALSHVSKASSQRARAEATAKVKALKLEMDHLRRRRNLEEQERQLRAQREEEELAMRLEQARLMEEAMFDDQLGQEDVRRNATLESPQRRHPEAAMGPAPQYLPPVATWALPTQRSGEQTVLGRAGSATEELLQQVLLPTSTLPVFKGDPLEFMWFMKAFEMRVEAVTSDPVRRLHLLLQHLEGDARTLVIGCQLADNAVEGYERAKTKLVTKYGNKIRQALAFKARLLAWPSIKKEATQELERFSVQLQLCEEVKLTGGLKELDAAGTILQLMHKLPYKMQEAWQMRAHKIETNHQREAEFKDFCRFVCDAAAARNHPVYGSKVETRMEQSTQKRGVKTLATAVETGADSGEEVAGTTLATSTNTQMAKGNDSAPREGSEAPCLFCQGAHVTAKCRVAGQMPIKERRSKLKGLCFACLRAGHNARQCPQRATCSKCKLEHPTVMHFDKDSKVEKSRDAQKENETAEQQTATSCATASPARVSVAVVPVEVWHARKKDCLTTKAILDPGSTATFITRHLAKAMGLQGLESSLKLTTMTAMDQTMTTQVVPGVKVAGVGQTEEVMLPPLYVVDQMPYDRDDVPKNVDAQSWNHLMEVPFNFDHRPDEDVGLLIGMNAPEALKPLQVIGGKRHEPYAIRTVLGWSLNGPLGERKSDRAAVANLIKSEQIQMMLKTMHEADFAGAYGFDSKGSSQEDREWEAKVTSSITKAPDSNCGQYQIALPFKDGKREHLKNNYDQAMARLMSLRRRFGSNAQFKEDYVQFLAKMELQEYIEEVDQKVEGHTVFYVPHHGVYHPRKPGKLRVVFNCSNKYEGVSLNDCLIPGPDLTSSLLGVLLRFRQESIAFISDIESMFYRVNIPRSDRDALRFLWWPGGDEAKDVKTYRMKVHLFGAASSPSCSNFALRRAAEDALKEGLINEEVCDAVKRNFYVDDCLKSMATEGAAVKMAEGLRQACAFGGFRLTKFVSTSEHLLKALPATELAKGITIDLNNKHDPVGSLQERALGVLWDVQRDVFRISVNPVKSAVVSKRSVLATLSAVYDPMGVAAPVIIVARVLFRSLTRKQEIGWDDDLSGMAETQHWRAWLETLPELIAIELPRCLKPVSTWERSTPEWELHIFCDASEDAYAAVAYLRQKPCEQQKAHVAFVLGKARVSPPKIVTIPRLELTAAKLATEVATLVQQELDYTISKRFFWTDSQTVLKYLANKVRRFHTFVANRVETILNCTSLDEWRYVPTRQNPADEGSRGLTPQNLQVGAWLWGPSFLREDEESWPKAKVKCDSNALADDPEVHTLAIKGDPESHSFIHVLAERYSTFFRLKKAVAMWQLFIRFILNPSDMQSSRRTANESWVDPARLKEAETSVIRSLQRAQWPQEYKLVMNGLRVLKSSPLYRVDPIMSESKVMVITSRTRRDLPIIPGENRVANLIVQEAHAKQAHFGRQATASQVLKTYWIIGLNKLVRKTIRNCPGCQRRFAKPKMPKMAELPEFRREGSRAFENTGVDYFGPFYIKRGRTQVKVYGVIFTCAVSRAVHLEAAEDLSSSAFLNALRRFVARRGHVRHLISDNGTNFVGAHSTLVEELKKELKQFKAEPNMIKTWLLQRDIQWTFNPPGASHHGGFWERMIRSIRRALGAILPSQRPLTYDGLVTVLCEIEATLNNRPLTTSEDLNDQEALTPNHLLLGTFGPVAPPGDYKRVAIPLKKQWRQVQHMANRFWRRWLQEYQALLHQRGKWLEDEGRPIAVGDVVLVIDSVRPREYWPLGCVVAVHPGKDNRVRVVTVKTVKGVFKRPVSKVCVLEAASESQKADVQITASDT